MTSRIPTWTCQYCSFAGNLLTDAKCFVCHRERSDEPEISLQESAVAGVSSGGLPIDRSDESAPGADVGAGSEVAQPITAETVIPQGCPQCGTARQPGSRFCASCAFDYWKAAESAGAEQSGGLGAPPADNPSQKVAGPAQPPPPASELHSEDLIGHRIAAALIDIALLIALFVLLGVTIGSSQRGFQGFAIYLEGAALLLYLALVVLYYLVLEATIGQSIGKVLVGLRVSRIDGARPGVGAIVVRNLVRLIDWLPAFYLVGFITVMVKGTRRQRLGDLAAKTILVRVDRSRFRIAALIGSVLFVVFVGFVVASWAAGGTGSCGEQGVSFEYPNDWQRLDPTTIRSSGNVLCTDVVGIRDETDAVVQVFSMAEPVTDAHDPALISQIQGLLATAGYVISGGPDEITLGGLPAIRLLTTFSVGGRDYEGAVVAAFAGTKEYWLNCEWTVDAAAEGARGCDQIVNTFNID